MSHILFRPNNRLARRAIVGTVTAFSTIALAVVPATAAPQSDTPHLLAPRPPGAVAALIPGALINHGGPVQAAPRVFVDFWGWTSDPSGEQTYLDSFLSSVGGTAWLATVNQYGGGSSGNLLFSTWSDGSAVPAAPIDAQIQQEALTAANHFGVGSSVNTEIIVATPTGHSTPGFGETFCAYHGAMSADPNVTYTNLPYMTDAGTACGEDSVNGANGTLDGVSIVEGHELAEASPIRCSPPGSTPAATKSATSAHGRTWPTFPRRPAISPCSRCGATPPTTAYCRIRRCRTGRPG
jgi:hypothetical protein